MTTKRLLTTLCLGAALGALSGCGGNETPTEWDLLVNKPRLVSFDSADEFRVITPGAGSESSFTYFNAQGEETASESQTIDAGLHSFFANTADGFVRVESNVADAMMVVQKYDTANQLVWESQFAYLHLNPAPEVELQVEGEQILLTEFYDIRNSGRISVLGANGDLLGARTVSDTSGVSRASYTVGSGNLRYLTRIPGAMPQFELHSVSLSGGDVVVIPDPGEFRYLGAQTVLLTPLTDNDFELSAYALDGSELWTASVEGTLGAFYSKDVFTAGGKLYTVLHTVSEDTATFEVRSHDATGQTEWTHSFTQTNSREHSYGQLQVRKDTNGGVIVSYRKRFATGPVVGDSNILTIQDFKHQIFHHRLDADGEPIAKIAEKPHGFVYQVSCSFGMPPVCTTFENDKSVGISENQVLHITNDGGLVTLGRYQGPDQASVVRRIAKYAAP